jgi:hypothetical protein
MTDNMTSQNIDLSSWDTLYNILFQMYFMCKFLHCSICIAISGLRVGVSIATQAWTGSQGCRRLKLLEFLDNRYRSPNLFMWCARNILNWPWSALRDFLEQQRGTKGYCNVSGHFGEIRSQNFMLTNGDASHLMSIRLWPDFALIIKSHICCG